MFHPKCGMSHFFFHYTISKETQHSTNLAEKSETYLRSPFCSSVTYSQGGKSTQIHPWCSHNPAHTRHCSHYIHLYLKRYIFNFCEFACNIIVMIFIRITHVKFELSSTVTLKLLCVAPSTYSPPQWASPYMV